MMGKNNFNCFAISIRVVIWQTLKIRNTNILYCVFFLLVLLFNELRIYSQRIENFEI